MTANHWIYLLGGALLVFGLPWLILSVVKRLRENSSAAPVISAATPQAEPTAPIVATPGAFDPVALLRTVSAIAREEGQNLALKRRFSQMVEASAADHKTPWERAAEWAATPSPPGPAVPKP